MSDSPLPPASPCGPGPAPPAILIVDDEPLVLTALKFTLERAGFPVVSCGNPLTALALLTRPFAVIISDQQMPDMLGLDFLVECRRAQPLSSRILVTGIMALPTIIDAINRGEIYRFLAKPWLREELIATVQNAIQRYELLTRNEALQAETQVLNTKLREANTSLEARVRDLEEQRQRLDLANQQLGENYEHSLELCRRILTTYDAILGGQAKLLVDIVAQMAVQAGFTETERHTLRTAAWLCDLGMIGMPREAMRAFRSRPDNLTAEEQAMLQCHPPYGQTLAALVDDSVELGEVIRAHHERYDGRGYPDGLSGDAIPWPARCLAVAVGFVECGSGKREAIEILLARSGTYYDPEAVRLFLKVSNLVQPPHPVRQIYLHEREPGVVLASKTYRP